MVDGTNLIYQAIIGVWDIIKFIGLMFVGLVMWKGNSANASDIPSITHEHVTNGLKNVGDTAGVSVGAVALGDAVGIVNWLDLVNDSFQAGIVILTFIYMFYRIVQVRADIKAKRNADKTTD